MRRAIFAEAVAAFAELLGDGCGQDVTHELSMRAQERDAQLVELLEELVFLADTAGFVPNGIAQIELAPGRRHHRRPQGSASAARQGRDLPRPGVSA